MHGHDHIVTDPDILCVKPGIKGSRPSVEFPLGLPNQSPGVAGWFVSVGEHSLRRRPLP